MSRTLVPLGYSVSENESGEDGASGIARDDDCAGLDSVGVRCFVQECPGVTGLVDLGRIALDGDSTVIGSPASHRTSSQIRTHVR